MAWILLEGLDRSGKSTVAEYYHKQGYEVVHMSSPHKRYREPGYEGPSYLEEMVEMYGLYKGQDVVFDRTVYGELVWPEVFLRMPLLNDEDYEYLAQLEYHENVERYLLWDEDQEAHWKRCAENKEPINRVQFVQAGRLYDKLTAERGFELKQLDDFSNLAKEVEKLETKTKIKSRTLAKNKQNSSKHGGDSNNAGSNPPSRSTNPRDAGQSAPDIVQRLHRANAIRTILESKIIKKKDSVYADIEEDIRGFLEDQLSELFETKSETSFSEDEMTVLKNMAQRILDKME